MSKIKYLIRYGENNKVSLRSDSNKEDYNDLLVNLKDTTWELVDDIPKSRYNLFLEIKGKIVADVESNNIIWKKELKEKLEARKKDHIKRAKIFFHKGESNVEIHEFNEKMSKNRKIFTANKGKIIEEKAEACSLQMAPYFKIISAYAKIILKYIENNEFEKTEIALNIVAEYGITTTLKDVSKLKSIKKGEK